MRSIAEARAYLYGLRCHDWTKVFETLGIIDVEVSAMDTEHTPAIMEEHESVIVKEKD
jgi:hypothetical protein